MVVLAPGGHVLRQPDEDSHRQGCAGNSRAAGGACGTWAVAAGRGEGRGPRERERRGQWSGTVRARNNRGHVAGRRVAGLLVGQRCLLPTEVKWQDAGAGTRR